MGNDGRQKTLMLPLLLSRGHGRSESSLAEEPTIKGLSLKTNLLSQDGAQVPLWVMCGRLRFGKVYFGCKLVECCHVSGLLLRPVCRWP